MSKQPKRTRRLMSANKKKLLQKHGDVELIHKREVNLRALNAYLKKAEMEAKIKAREEEFRGNWAQTDLRNDRMCELVGITFRPFDESLRDCVESLMSIGGVEPERTDEYKARL